MKQEKSLIKHEKLNLFQKVKNFFSRIFHKKAIVKQFNYEQVSTKKQSELDLLRKEQELLSLQERYENGDIKEEELTDTEKQELTVLYKKQIRILQENITEYKNKLNNYKEKIVRIRDN